VEAELCAGAIDAGVPGRDLGRGPVRQDWLLAIDLLQPQLAAANKTFASQFNPAIGFIVDTVFSSSRKEKSNFEFRSAEIGISATAGQPRTRSEHVRGALISATC
jgi:hypothetical protein